MESASYRVFGLTVKQPAFLGRPRITLLLTSLLGYEKSQYSQKYKHLNRLQLSNIRLAPKKKDRKGEEKKSCVFRTTDV